MKTIPSFYFDPSQLANWVKQFKDQFNSAQPFPHVVIDNFVPEEILKLLIGEFPGPNDIDWDFQGPGNTRHSDNELIEKIGTSNEALFGSFTRHFMSQLYSGTFLSFLESLTGVKGIIPDPSFNGCGLHSTGPGGKLMIHTDINRYPIPGRFHQIFNLIFFINNDWKEEYGGHLNLYNEDASQCIKSVLPVANRCVIFNTGSKSYHGHPTPLSCPPDRRRNSLAVYYYVLDRPIDEQYEGYQDNVGWVPLTFEEKIRWFLKNCIPPIFLKIFRFFRK